MLYGVDFFKLSSLQNSICQTIHLGNNSILFKGKRESNEKVISSLGGEHWKSNCFFVEEIEFRVVVVGWLKNKGKTLLSENFNTGKIGKYNF